MNWDRVERYFGKSILEHLRQKTVAIVGLGSGGGFVAQGLAMSGIENFVLVDDDTLDAVNLTRHVADQHDLGKPKVEAVQNLILRRNPKAKIKTRIGKIETNTDVLSEVDIVVSAVDHEGAKYTINELCLKHNLPAVYAGVYAKGEGGDVVTIHPYEGACYACWALNLRDGHLSSSPNSTDELDYGQVNEHGTLDAEPALWLHVTRVAATQADMVINVLLADTSEFRKQPANTVILANTYLEVFEGHPPLKPYSAEWIHIARNPDCLVCGQKHKQDRVSLEALANDLVIFESDEAQNQHQQGSKK